MKHPIKTACLLLGCVGFVAAHPTLAAGEPPDTNYDESKVPPYELPDPLLTVDGRKVSDATMWRETRRPEILEAFARNVYGRTPEIETRLRFEKTAEDSTVFGGLATRRQIRIRLFEDDDAPWIDLLIYVPNKPGRPAPVFLGLNYGNQGVHPDPGIAPSRNSICQRGEHAHRWPLEMILKRGYAVASFHGGDLELDQHGSGCRFTQEAWQEGIRHWVVRQGGRTELADDEWGSIGAWAWGLSRALDYLQTDPSVAANRVAVFGHSRTGKTALWAGAQDQRFAMVISNNSGQGGASLARRRYGETVAASWSLSGIWYCRNYQKYGNNEAALPVDAHSLIALMAPRPVYVASAEQDRWADPRGEFLAALHAEPVYALLERPGLGVADMPGVDRPVGRTIGYHVRTGGHEITRYDWGRYLDFADSHLRQRRVLYNFDGDSCLFTKAGSKGPVPITTNDVNRLIEEVAYDGSRVDTVLVCVNAQVMYYPTRVGTMRGTHSSPEERAQWPASEKQRFENMKAFFDNGVDPYAIMLEETKRRGREALLTFRMNDDHGNDFLRTQFLADHPDWRLGTEQYRGKGAMDFGREEARDYTFRVIEEAVKRYDCDGIELDFNRFPAFFKTDIATDERIARMNALVERVRTMLDDLARQRGRRLTLAVRVPSNFGRTPPTPETSRQIGCNVPGWVRQGWVDFVTVSEFLYERGDLPIDKWKQAIPSVPVYGGIECTRGGGNKNLTAEEYRLAARELRKAGADGAYLFNFFTSREGGETACEPPFEALRDLGALVTVSRTGEGSDSSPERVVLANAHLTVSAEPRDTSWNVVWPGAGPVDISNAVFAVEAGGERLALSGAQSSVAAFRDPIGEGQELRQVWRVNGVCVIRELRVYNELDAMTIGGRIVNETAQDIVLGNANLLELGTNGLWRLGRATERPAALYIQGHSLLQSMPFLQAGSAPSPEQAYRSSGVLTLAARDPQVLLVLGFVRADEAAPALSAHFQTPRGGTRLAASSPFLGRKLRSGATIELNRLYIASSRDVYQAMEDFGDAMARFAARPPHTGPTGLWCSWYAHRMGMTEDKVLANAEVAARYFKPLGLEIMQLDHGWQRGDITGDWTPNERFPHGLRWLADQLRDRHGLRLGVWIAPTDVAETSDVFRQHPEWLLKGPDGKPLVNWRWYWKPNPNCFELDATHPDAARYIVDSFRQLAEQGVSYFKIDFIAAAGGEHFVQHDPCSTRGWSVLRRAMEAIRTGAGQSAWIRYCQTPPVLGAGLANSTIGGNDTLDAGVPGRFDVLRENAGALAAGWWLNDRPYHREVCDMSVRMQGSLEEARVRAAIMTLANCSISWSDELCYLPPSRVRLMQQCMPPGNPPMRPMDLFDRDIPSVWHIHATNVVESWDVVGLFNLNPQPERRAIRFGQLGLDPDADYLVFEFWEEKFLGRLKGSLELTLAVPPESSRIFSIRRVTGRPQLVGTDMHLLQGVHEIRRLEWDHARQSLSGLYHRMPGVAARAFFYLPEGWSPKFEFPLSPASARLTHVDGPLWMQEIEFELTSGDWAWTIPFEPPKPPPPSPKEPAG